MNGNEANTDAGQIQNQPTTVGTVTQEEFDTLKAELEAEKARTEAAVEAAVAAAVILHEKDTERITTLQAEASAKGDEITTLKGETDGHTQGLAALTQERDTARTEAENWQAAHDYAVADYRALVLSSNPVFSDELITGASIEEVKASVGKATALVGKVKESLDAQAQALAQLTTIPAGSPQRQAVDLSAMSTREKINYGLSEARKDQ